MTNKELKGCVILFKGDKSLLQVKKVRIYQRENLVDRISFLIPITYEWLNSYDSAFDMTKFNVILNYVGPDGTVQTEILERYMTYNTDTEQKEYIDYQKDEDSNFSHMIYRLPVTTKLSKVAGDYTLSLRLTYFDYQGQTDDPDSEPVACEYNMSSGSTILTVLPVTDYYSVVSSDTLSDFIKQIDMLKNRAETLEERADSQQNAMEEYNANMVDDIVLNYEEQSIYLTNKSGKKVGTEIGVEDLSNEMAEHSEDGLVRVIVSDDEEVDAHEHTTTTDSDEVHSSNEKNNTDSGSTDTPVVSLDEEVDDEF